MWSTETAPRRVPRTPREASIAITSACNQRCRYCFFRDSPAEADRDLTLGEWLECFRALGRAAVLRVELQGGEPFLRSDLEQIIAGIVENGMRYRILTNGSLIDARKAACLAASRRCDVVRVSLDGPTDAVHDSLRGEGTFRGALRGIAELLRHGITVTAMVTLHRENVRSLEATVRFILDELGLPGLSVVAVLDQGSCRASETRVCLDPVERSRAMDTLWRLRGEYGARIFDDSGVPAESESWRCIDERARSPGACAGGARIGRPGRLSVCDKRYTTISIRSDGVYVPCMHLAHIELGRVDRNDLGHLWRNHAELNRLRSRDTITLASFESCHDCRFADACTGGCPAAAYASSGDDARPDPGSCLRELHRAGGWLSGRGDAATEVSHEGEEQSRGRQGWEDPTAEAALPEAVAQEDRGRHQMGRNHV